MFNSFVDWNWLNTSNSHSEYTDSSNHSATNTTDKWIQKCKESVRFANYGIKCYEGLWLPYYSNKRDIYMMMSVPRIVLEQSQTIISSLKFKTHVLKFVKGRRNYC